MDEEDSLILKAVCMGHKVCQMHVTLFTSLQNTDFISNQFESLRQKQ